jgi:hypothetical protein
MIESLNRKATRLHHDKPYPGRQHGARERDPESLQTIRIRFRYPHSQIE